MATATFHTKKGKSNTGTLTASAKGQTTNCPMIIGPTGVDQLGRRGRTIFIKQSTGVFREVGFEVAPAGASTVTTYDCKD